MKSQGIVFFAGHQVWDKGFLVGKVSVVAKDFQEGFDFRGFIPTLLVEKLLSTDLENWFVVRTNLGNLILGSLSNDDGDGNDNAGKQWV